MKNKLLIIAICITVGIQAQFKFDPKQVEKIKLVLTKDFVSPYNLETLKGIDMELDRGKVKKLVADLNIMKSVVAGEAQFKTCAAIVMYFKDGSNKVFYGNGKRFNEIIKEKISGEYYTMTAWNLVEKYWGLKKEVLCED